MKKLVVKCLGIAVLLGSMCSVAQVAEAGDIYLQLVGQYPKPLPEFVLRYWLKNNDPDYHGYYAHGSPSDTYDDYWYVVASPDPEDPYLSEVVINGIPDWRATRLMVGHPDLAMADGGIREQPDETIWYATPPFAYGRIPLSTWATNVNDCYATGSGYNCSGSGPTRHIHRNSRFVYQLYQFFLAREPDPGGFDSWLGWLNQCAITDVACVEDRRRNLVKAFVESEEYRIRFGDTSPTPEGNRNFVNSLYGLEFNNPANGTGKPLGMLGRSGDPGGIDSWTSCLNNGTSRLDLINAFLESWEFQNRFGGEIRTGIRLNCDWNKENCQPAQKYYAD